TAAEPGGASYRQRWSYERFRLLERWSTSFEHVGAYSGVSVNLTDGELPERLAAEVGTAGYFPALGVTPLRGRTFTAADDSAAAAVALVSWELWQRRWGGKEPFVGRSIRVNDTPLTVVGVTPRGFGGMTGEAQLWIPPAMAPVLSYPGYLTTNQNFISSIARLAPGVSVDRARSEMERLGERVEAAVPSEPDVPGTRFGATLLPLDEVRIDPANRRALTILMVAVGFVLLLSCANVANLLLGRALERRREIAVRLGIGAGRSRIVRQLVTESVVLAGLGTGAGLLIASFALDAIRVPARRVGPASGFGAVAEFMSTGIDHRVLVFAVAAGLLTVLLFGLAPAIGATRVSLTRDLRHGGTGSGGSRAHRAARIGLVIVQVALAFVLTSGAGLLAASLRNLRGTELGFDPHNVLTFRVEPSDAAYPPPDAARLHERILANLEGIRGVTAATVDGCVPVARLCASSELHIVGRPPVPEGQAPVVMRHYVGPDHFRTLGIALLRGRPLSADDRDGRPGVVVINEAAARRYWPDQDPIGAHVWFGSTVFDAPDRSAEVVGVVADTPDEPLAEGGVRPAFYSSYLQFTWAARDYMVRTNGDPMLVLPAIRRVVRDADPTLPIFDVRTLDDLVSGSWARTRFIGVLLAAFAAIALVLAAVGIYGVLAHMTGLRFREMEIRMALGGSPGAVTRQVLGEAMTIAGIGIAVGAGGALLASRTLRALLFGVNPTDPRLFVALAAVLAAVAFLASWVPARRAARVDPRQALRQE
ncbi:MAG: ADOP family duplicated permease, partial [Gemmatimonadota bacterium]